MTSQASVSAVAAPEAWEAAVCSWPDDAARAWVSDAVRRAVADPAMHAFVATGSAVLAVDRRGDVDLVLVYRAVRPRLPRSPMSVDLCLYDGAGVAARLALGQEHLCWSVRFGRVEKWWSRLRAEWGRQALRVVASELSIDAVG